MPIAKIEKCILCGQAEVSITDDCFGITCDCGRGSYATSAARAIIQWNAQAKNKGLAERSRYYKEAHAATYQLTRSKKPS